MSPGAGVERLQAARTESESLGRASNGLVGLTELALGAGEVEQQMQAELAENTFGIVRRDSAQGVAVTVGGGVQAASAVQGVAVLEELVQESQPERKKKGGLKPIAQDEEVLLAMHPTGVAVVLVTFEARRAGGQHQ